jgi:hypothetical protein
MTNNFDPRGEYTRVCPYCRESFVADHLNRFYCPDKNGRKNFCKNRQKRINDNLRKSGSVLIAHENNPIKVFIEEPEIKERNIDQLIISAQKSKNISIPMIGVIFSMYPFGNIFASIFLMKRLEEKSDSEDSK